MDKKIHIVRGERARCQTHAAPFERQTDKRALPRQRSVFRLARVSAEAEAGFARVMNISDGGLMLSLQLGVRPGSILNIDLSEAIRLSGEVIWFDGAKCGVRLFEPIDSAATLVRLFADSVRGTDRPLRLPCSSEATAMGDFGTLDVQIEDISLRGLKVRHEGQLKEGQRVKMLLGALPEREGVVRWCRGGRAGISMIEPFSLQDLGSTEKLGRPQG